MVKGLAQNVERAYFYLLRSVDVHVRIYRAQGPSDRMVVGVQALLDNRYNKQLATFTKVSFLTASGVCRHSAAVEPLVSLFSIYRNVVHLEVNFIIMLHTVYE